jgi:hypothetical protein
MDTREWIDASTIGGNAPQALKQSLVDLVSAIAKLNNARGMRGFEPEIASRIEWTDISIMPKTEEPERLEGRVVGEITVQEGAVLVSASRLVCSSFIVSPRVHTRYVERTRNYPWCLLCVADRQVRLIPFHSSQTSLAEKPRLRPAAPRCLSPCSTWRPQVKATWASRSPSTFYTMHPP